MIRTRKAMIKDEAKIFDLLRQLIPAEAPDYSPVRSQSGINTFREMVNNDEKGTILVAEEDNDVVGVITLSYPEAIRCGGKYTCIEEFIVSEQMRGKGVGGRLLEAAVKEATLKDCYEIQVNRPSELGYPLYIRHGWEDLGKHLNMRLSREQQ